MKTKLFQVFFFSCLFTFPVPLYPMASTNRHFYPWTLLASILSFLFVVRSPFNRAAVSCWGRTIDRPMGLVDSIETAPTRLNDTAEPYSKSRRRNLDRKHGWDSLQAKIAPVVAKDRSIG